MLFSRALLAFLMLPGATAFLAPSLLVPQLSTRRFHLVDLVPFIAGVARVALVLS